METDQIILAQRPAGLPSVEDFQLRRSTLAAPAVGEVLVRVRALSLDPYQRLAMAGRHLSAPVAPGEVIRGDGLVEVLSSRDARLQPGELWVAPCGWRSHALLDAAALALARAVPAELDPPTLALGCLGMPGLTAWAGFTRLAQARPGDTLVVSAATGPVGATVAQLALHAGCRVVGIAGGADKCAWAVDHARLHACIDHRGAALGQELARHCPDGVDVYFDNVGGSTQAAVLAQLAVGARVVLCGLAAQHNGEAAPGLSAAALIRARATVRGLVVYDHLDAWPDTLAALMPMLRSGELAWREDISTGLHQAPAAFVRLMRGDNRGKALVHLP